jgi:hypothetical protein
MARTGIFATLACLALAATAEAQMMVVPQTTTSSGRTGLFARMRARNTQPMTYVTPGTTMGTYSMSGTWQPMTPGTTVVSGTPGTTWAPGTIVYSTPGTTWAPGTIVYTTPGTPGQPITSPGTVINPTPGTTYQPMMAGTTMTQPTRGVTTYRNRLLGRRNAGATMTPYAMTSPTFVPGTYVVPR